MRQHLLHAANSDDPAPAAFGHRGKKGLQQLHRGPQVDRDLAVEVRAGDGSEVLGQFDGGIQHQDVHGRPAGDGGGEACAGLVLPEILAEGGGLPARGLDFGHDGIGIDGLLRGAGVVDRERMLTGENIVAGDVLYAINSSGLHTNGFSLARKLIFEIGGCAIDARPEELAGQSIADALLAPHTNYVAPVRNILDAGIPVKGMAHITGGGLVENVPRILPDGLGVVIDSATWKPQPVFVLMQRLGNIDDLEMHRTFNMGVGLVLIGPPGLQDELAAATANFPALRVWELGRVEANAKGVRFGGVN